MFNSEGIHNDRREPISPITPVHPAASTADSAKKGDAKNRVSSLLYVLDALQDLNEAITESVRSSSQLVGLTATDGENTADYYQKTLQTKSTDLDNYVKGHKDDKNYAQEVQARSTAYNQVSQEANTANQACSTDVSTVNSLQEGVLDDQKNAQTLGGVITSYDAFLAQLTSKQM